MKVVGDLAVVKPWDEATCKPEETSGLLFSYLRLHLF